MIIIQIMFILCTICVIIMLLGINYNAFEDEKNNCSIWGTTIGYFSVWFMLLGFLQLGE